MQSHPTRGWSGHLHVTADVWKPVSPLCKLHNIKVFLFWVFPSASCTIINIELTFSSKQINILHLSLKIWHSTDILTCSEVFYQWYNSISMKQQSEAHCLRGTYLFWYCFEIIKICLCCWYFLHTILTGSWIIISKTRQILSRELACAWTVCYSEPEGMYHKR